MASSLITTVGYAELVRMKAICAAKLTKLNELLLPTNTAGLTRAQQDGLIVAQNWWIEQRAAINTLLMGKTMGFTYKGEDF